MKKDNSSEFRSQTITKLNFSFHQIADLSFLFDSNNIAKLDLAYNQISDLSPLTHLTKLTQLNLTSNQIFDLTPLSSLTDLEILYLSGNQISDLTPLLALKKLIFLDLTENLVSDISLLSSLTNLTVKIKNGKFTNISFENWLKYVFDHPVASEHDAIWYWDEDWGSGIISPLVTVAHITRTFENSHEVLKPFSDAQLNQGFWFLVSNSCSDQMLAIQDDSVPEQNLQRCIRSIFTLFEQCFARRCSPHLSHIDEPNANPLNSICYMWWDIFPWYGCPTRATHRHIDAEFLHIMQKILYLDSDACRESALHGLGHWQHSYPDRVVEIIDEFLVKKPNIRSELKQYATYARMGCVQ
jgi:Leucine Rich repeat